jgi:hypothetical protein
MVQRIIPNIGHLRIRAFDLRRREAVFFLKRKPGRACYLAICKKGIGKKDYFLGLSASYSARMGAMVFVDMDRRTSVVSFRQ